MAKATNTLEVTRQVDNWIRAATAMVSAIELMRQVVNNDVAVGQTWNSIPTDYPDLLDADGAFLNTTFTPSEIQQLENNCKKILDQWNNVSPPNPPTGNLDKIFRQISGVV